MTVEGLSCGKCQAPLAVTAATFSVSCPACGQWHTINHSGPAPTATPFEDAVAETAPPAEAGDAVGAPEPVQDEVLAQLDHAWQTERKQHLVFSWTGDITEPTLVGALVLGAIPAAIGGGILLLKASAGFSDQLAGWLFLAAGIGLGVYRVRQMLAYQEAYRRYQRRHRASSKPKKQDAAKPQAE